MNYDGERKYLREEQPKTGADVLQPIWFEVDDPVASFTNNLRKSELENLHLLLTATDSHFNFINQIAVVAGMPGVGKTELARKYAHVYEDRYLGNVIWINAETRESLQSSLHRLLTEHFHISENQCNKMNDSDSLKIVYKFYSQQSSGCLIIFDDVGAVNVIDLLPKNLGSKVIPTVLITSQITKWKPGIQQKVLVLGVFKAEDAMNFIRKTLLEDLNEDQVNGLQVMKLAETLDSLPLALQQAVTYIRAELSEDPNPISAYLKIFKSEDRNQLELLLDYHNTELSETTKSVFTTLSSALTRIRTEPLATRIMSIISFMEPNAIPTEIFTESFGQQSEKLSQNVNKVIGLLKKYSIVSGPVGKINVHRLVQLVVRLKLSSADTKNVLQEGLDMLSKYMALDMQCSNLVKSLILHSETLWRHGSTYEELVSKYSAFPTYVCEKLCFYGKYEVMHQLARDSRLIIERVHEIKHPATIYIRFQEARALLELNKHPESLDILKCIFPVAKRELGNDNQWTLDIYSMLATHSGIQGKHGENLKILEEIEAIQLKKYGPEHRDTLGTLQNKAVTLLELKRLDESLELFQNVWEARKRILGEEDPSTLMTKNWIAEVLIKTERNFHEALAIYESVYKSQKLVLGEKHPDTLITLYRKAIALRKLERLNESLKIFQYVWEMEKKVFGDEHDETLATQSSIADVLKQKGDYGETLEILEKIYESQKRTLGDQHLDTLYTKFKKAHVLDKLDRLHEALELFQNVWEGINRILGDENENTVLTRHCIADILTRQGDFEEALTIYGSVYELQKLVLGVEHPDTLITLIKKAIALWKLERLDESLEIFQCVWEMEKRVYGDEHDETLATQCLIADVLIQKGDYGEALEILGSVYEPQKRTLGDQHPNTLNILFKRAQLLYKLDRLDESLEVFCSVWEGERCAFGENHANTLKTKRCIDIIKKRIYKSAENSVQIMSRIM